ncbi:MAG TPA: glycoside hydrolase family 43 protein [Marinagarivorans sp.]
MASPARGHSRPLPSAFNRLAMVASKLYLLLLTAFGLSGCVEMPFKNAAPSANSAVFSHFEYRGEDALFAAPLADDQYQNPVLAGFHPDPSITRVGDDFYLINSSFAFSPGIPIFHSTDLVNWRSLGHVLNRAGQVDLDEAGVSRGIYAPTIRYHQGTFYVIATAVDHGGNFIVTANDPQGPWSDPIWLPEVTGIDPDIFFDDDGRTYIAHNSAPEGEPLYEGHRAIWLWEYDLANKRVVANSGRVIVNGGADISQEPIWVEGPHLYKKDGWYYLTCAEGGTGPDHSQVIFRSKKVSGPFTPYENNPILTQRDLPSDRQQPINNAGHADFVQTPSGEWWAVFLAVRNYQETQFNTGRETFLLPVTWRDGWPHILPAKTPVPARYTKPKGLNKTPNAEAFTGNFTWTDSFEQKSLSHRWQMLRTGHNNWYQLQPEKGHIALTPTATTLADTRQPAALLHRQQHTRYFATTTLLLPTPAETSAGITAFQNEDNHYYFAVKTTDKGLTLFLEQRINGLAHALMSVELPQRTNTVNLEVNVDAGAISFYYQLANGDKVLLAENLDASILSSDVAGGFVGAHVGLHARQEPAAENSN